MKHAARWTALILSLLLWSAARAATPNLNSYFPQSFTDFKYQKSCFEKVLKAWSVPKARPQAGRKTVILATIARDGKIASSLLSLKSGSKPWDDAALSAVRKAAPFGPLPRSYAGAQVEVHWHFVLVP